MVKGKERNVPSKSKPEKQSSKQPRRLSRPKDKFMAVDLKSADSILVQFPILEGMGTQKTVPPHFIGHDTDYEEAMWKINEFRHLSTEQQQSEHSRWNAMKRREKDLYRRRINILEEKQTEMRQENGISAPVSKKRRKKGPPAVTPANPPNSQPSVNPQPPSTVLQANVASATATESDGTVESSADSNASRTLDGNSGTSSTNDVTAAQEAGDTNSTAPPITATATRQPDTSVRNSPLDTATTTVEPPEIVDETEPLENVTNKYKGLASSAEERRNALPKPSNTQSSSKKITRKRKKGLPCQDVSQQSDATSMKSVHDAIIATSKAIDTTTLPGRAQYAPGHKIALFILNEVKETDKTGGGTNIMADSWRRTRPKLTVVTTSKRDCKDVLNAVVVALKEKNRDGGYDVKAFYSDSENAELVLPKAKAFVDQYTSNRRAPPTKPRTWNEIQAQQARENRES